MKSKITLCSLFFSLFLCIVNICNVSAQTWEQLNDSPFLTDHTNGFGYGDKAYVIEGFSGQNGTNTLWEYTAETDNWQNIGVFPGQSRGFAIGDEWNDKYYYGFGSNRNDLWEFDPVDQSFTQLPSCPCIGRAHPALIAHNDKIFMGTGSSNNGDLKDWWEYDMLTQVWTQKENVPGNDRHHPFFFGIGDKVYVGGGHVNSWYEFDMTTEAWTAIDSEPGGRVAGSQTQFNNKGYLIGGDNSNHVHVPDDESFMRFDPETGEWEQLPPLPNGSRWANSSFIIGNNLYFFDGYSSNNNNDDSMWKFDLAALDCISAQNVSALNITETSTEIFWMTNSNIMSDDVYWRELGETEWSWDSNETAAYELTGLEPCTEYEFKIISECESLDTESEIKTFRTAGCGACIDLDFCAIPNGLDGVEFIDEVRINSYINETGSNAGYGNFTVPNPESIFIGEAFDLTLIPGFTNAVTPLNFTVWIDFNIDGEFTNNEVVVSEAVVSDEITENILVPESAVEGTSRIRILYGSNETGNPCNDIMLEFGEMEDYCIELKTPIVGIDDNDLNLVELTAFPNPFRNSFKLNLNNTANQTYEIYIVNAVGELILNEVNNSDQYKIDLSQQANGIYYLTVKDALQNETVLKLMKQF